MVVNPIGDIKEIETVIIINIFFYFSIWDYRFCHS